MKRIIIVSNRLPIQVMKQKESIKYKSSIGGLATGLRSVHNQKGSLWFGWCGIKNEKQ